MASPSPPSSPRHSDFDPDVNDSQYWRNPTPPRQPQREHISFYDLLEGHERYGDVLVEGESESPPSVVPPPAAHAHQPAPVTTGEEMPDAVDDEPAIVTASRDAKTVQTEADILDSLRKIAVAPPPYAFPAVSFTPVWPDLNKYTSMDGATPPDPDFWAIPEHLDQGRHEVAMKLHRLSHAGMRLCTRRIGNGDQSIETYILDVRNLLHAALDVFKLGPLDFDLPQTEPYQPHDSLIKWKAGKMLFAVDHATTVIDAEGAYHNASVIRDPYFDWEETLLVKHRLEAVLQRNIKWDKIVKARNFTCNLLTTYVSQNVEMFRTVLRREVSQLIAVTK